jgi:hypothetical protein
MSAGGSAVQTRAARQIRPWPAERRFYSLFSLAIFATVLLGFARTFYLRAWFPEWASLHAPAEPIFYVHGGLLTAWLMLLVLQAWLIGARRADLHRRIGVFGTGLAALAFVVGLVAMLVAAGRPTGFIDITEPPLEFLAGVLADLLCFGAFVWLAIFNRRNAQAHKRFMILAALSFVGTAVARWPFELMIVELPAVGLTVMDLIGYLFLLPLALWDLASRRRLHAVTLWGSVAFLAIHEVAAWVSKSAAWLAVAKWAVGSVGAVFR